MNHMLRGVEGHWMDSEEQNKYHVTYFRNLFVEEVNVNINRETRYKFTPLNDGIIEELNNFVTEEEIKQPLFGRQPWKALCLDGYQAGLYQVNLDILESSFYNHVRHMWSVPL